MYNGQNKVWKVGFADDLIPQQLFVKVYNIMMIMTMKNNMIAQTYQY